MPRPPNRLQVHFEVADEKQTAELNTAWQEIISGRRTRVNIDADDVNEIMERPRTGLATIVKAIEGHPGTGQWRRTRHEN